MRAGNISESGGGRPSRKSRSAASDTAASAAAPPRIGDGGTRVVTDTGERLRVLKCMHLPNTSDRRTRSSGSLVRLLRQALARGEQQMETDPAAGAPPPAVCAHHSFARICRRERSYHLWAAVGSSQASLRAA